MAVWTFPRKTKTYSGYLKPLSTHTRSLIYREFKSLLLEKGWDAKEKGLPAINDEVRGSLELACFRVADAIENRGCKPTDTSRKVHDVRCRIHEDIQANRDEFSDEG
jgi:hypothetical protein